MWFNTLKKGSLKKAVEKSTLKAVPDFFNYELTEIGIVVNKSEASLLPDLIKAFEKRSLHTIKIKFLIYSSESKKSLDENCFGFRDFSVSGSTENKSIRDFIDTKFDILISYYTKQSIPLMWITAKSNAIFKMGISDDICTLNHFSLSVDSVDTEIFVDNLYKYITSFKH